MAKKNHWGLWAPYWKFIEDSFLDKKSITYILNWVQEPALVIGAGQGILVEELHNHRIRTDGIDLDPEMVKYAKIRRNLDILCENATKMEFKNKIYQTSIIATGVIDFMEDENEIHSIISEAKRVTKDSGKIFIAFYKMYPQSEKLMRYIGSISENNRWLYRNTLKLTMLTPYEAFKIIKHQKNISLFNILISFIKYQFLPKNEKLQTKSLRRIWKKAKYELDNPMDLISCVPEFLPYRKKDDIKLLFNTIGVKLEQIMEFESCIIVEVCN